MQRNNKEYILLAMSFGSALAILPFALYRFILGDWYVAAADLSMVLGMFAIGCYVYWKRETHIAAIILSVLAFGGMCIVVYLKGPFLVFWAYPTMVGMYFVLSPRLAVVFSMVVCLILVPVLAQALSMVMFITIFMTLMVNNLFAFIFARSMYRQSEILTQLTRVDPLTGAGNRRALDEKLTDVLHLIKRHPQPVSLILIDIDYFKRINDNFGHAVGDQVLIKLVKLIKKRIRATDCIYRLGGEEFVVLTVGADKLSAKKISEELRLLIQAHEFISGHEVTASFGVSIYAEGEEVEDWMDRADGALYQAKDSGRNQVLVAV